MEIFQNPDRKNWDKFLSRPSQKQKKLKKIVKPIMKKVKRNGDNALIKFAVEFDLVHIERLAITEKEIQEAAALVPDELKDSIQLAKRNIERFHEAQANGVLQVETTPGVYCSRKSVPIEKVGLYVPAGTAPLFSTVLMLGIPARLAGCKDVILCTPPDKTGHVHPAILYTCGLLGIRKIFKTGGAQAIAAMLYGTESIPKVDKIFGPGNQYVTVAKLIAAERGVAIDMPAGPSEIAVYADETARPAFVAADLLSQAEHGGDSQVILVAAEQQIADAVMQEVEHQLEKLPRKDIARQALKHSKVFVMDDVNEAMDLLNAYAPEHLVLASDRARELAEQVINAGSVFLGHFSPESAGDYASGTNHTLPTNGYARSFSGVSLDSFVKKITFQEISSEGLKNIGAAVINMAEAEQLKAHARAVSIRLKSL